LLPAAWRRRPPSWRPCCPMTTSWRTVSRDGNNHGTSFTVFFSRFRKGESCHPCRRDVVYIYFVLVCFGAQKIRVYTTVYCSTTVYCGMGFECRLVRTCVVILAHRPQPGLTNSICSPAKLTGSTTDGPWAAALVETELGFLPLRRPSPPAPI
jgi:hypothetical protein